MRNAMTGRRERFRDIAETFSRHGLGFLLAALGVDTRILGPAARFPAGQDQDQGLPQRLRLALEDLGAVYVKFGQVLSTRSDLLPAEYVAELAKLQDGTPSVPFKDIREVIEAELGPEAAKLLSTMDPSPLATGSIGQAHVATVQGRDVVVKVRRPGIVEQVNNDLEIMAEIAKLAEQASATARGLHLADTVEEFAATLRGELDYLAEGRNAERFARDFATDQKVHIPDVFWNTTTSRVLTLQRMRGLKITDVQGLRAADLDPSEVASRACNVLLRMVFEHGFFHADPHPGNFFVEADGRFGIIDFGMVGHVSDDLKHQLVKLLQAIVVRDPHRMTTALLRLCGAGQTTRRAELQSHLAKLLGRYADQPLSEVPLTKIVNDVVAMLRRHQLRLPPDTALLIKMLAMAEGLGQEIDPSFDLLSEVSPYAQRLMLASVSPGAIAEQLKLIGSEALHLGSEAPELIRRVTEILESGGVDLRIRAEELDQLMDRLDHTGNRIVAGLVTAALITAVGGLVGSQPTRWHRWPQALFTAGVGGVGALGGYLAWTSRRRRS